MVCMFYFWFQRENEYIVCITIGNTIIIYVYGLDATYNSFIKMFIIEIQWRR